MTNTFLHYGNVLENEIPLFSHVLLQYSLFQNSLAQYSTAKRGIDQYHKGMFKTYYSIQ